MLRGAPIFGFRRTTSIWAAGYNSDDLQENRDGRARLEDSCCEEKTNLEGHGLVG